jgi:putative ABC transport system permease protein
MIGDYVGLAFKNLRKRGLRSWLTMLGIFLGIAAVVSLISLGNGLQEAITGQFATLDADKLLIQNSGTGFGPPGSTSVRKLTDDDLELIKSVSGVQFAISRLLRSVTIEFNKVTKFTVIGSIPANEDEIEIVYDSLNLDIELGRELEEIDRGKIIIGHNYIDNDDFGKKIKLGSNLIIQGESFEIIGIMKKSGFIFLNDALFMAEDDMKKILDIDNEIDVIIVQVEDADGIEKVSEDISRKIRKDRGQKIGEEDFSVQTPLESVGAVNTVLNVINLIVVGIAAISLFIGGIGIANTMYTSVLERKKEIGVMKSIGARNKDILSIFLFESALLGLVGGIVGALIGLSLAFLVSRLAGEFLGGINLLVSVNYPLLFSAISFSLVVGVLSGILPAIQASRLNPVEALRG